MFLLSEKAPKKLLYTNPANERFGVLWTMLTYRSLRARALACCHSALPKPERPMGRDNDQKDIENGRVKKIIR